MEVKIICVFLAYTLAVLIIGMYLYHMVKVAKGDPAPASDEQQEKPKAAVVSYRFSKQPAIPVDEYIYTKHYKRVKRLFIKK